MRFEDLIDKPLHELTEDDIQAIIDELSPEQLQALERRIKTSMRKRPVSSKAKKQREEEFTKALLGHAD